MKTTPTKADTIVRAWHIFDMKDQILGRTATLIAGKLMGKGKPTFVPYLDCGDHVVVINATRVVVTGKKAKQKIYDRFSGYPGGRKVKTYEKVMEEEPTRIIIEAVGGMLPNNKLKDQMLKRLYVYPDSEHPYIAKFMKG
jgi:large subunit ribosomal protein L13